MGGTGASLGTEASLGGDRRIPGDRQPACTMPCLRQQPLPGPDQAGQTDRVRRVPVAPRGSPPPGLTLLCLGGSGTRHPPGAEGRAGSVGPGGVSRLVPPPSSRHAPATPGAHGGTWGWGDTWGRPPPSGCRGWGGPLTQGHPREWGAPPPPRCQAPNLCDKACLRGVTSGHVRAAAARRGRMRCDGAHGARGDLSHPAPTAANVPRHRRRGGCRVPAPGTDPPPTQHPPPPAVLVGAGPLGVARRVTLVRNLAQHPRVTHGTSHGHGPLPPKVCTGV